MIFVTVGTHEQPFDRLVRGVDQLKKDQIIRDDVFIQTGYSDFRPEYCDYKDFIPFGEMTERMSSSDLVVTHGGTGSVMLVLYHGKVPLVVPRQKKYGEHIDDHQVLFCRFMEGRGRIAAAYEVGELGGVIDGYFSGHYPVLEESVEELREKAGEFSRRLEALCLEL